MFNDPIARVSELVTEHLDEIKALFKPGAKITIAVRNPDEQSAGAMDFVMTDDDLTEAIKVLERRIKRGNEYAALQKHN